MDKNLMILALVGLLAFVYIGQPGALAQGSGGTSGTGAPADLLTCPTIITQTTDPVSYDADKPGTEIASPTLTYYTNAGTGAKFAGGNQTAQLGIYDILVQKANYASTLLKGYKTSCVSTDAPSVFMKQYDTAITSSVYNSNGITANTMTVGGNISLAASATATAHVKLQQTTTYKHLSGPTNEFAVWVNTTNVSDWDVTQLGISFDGVTCAQYSSVQPSDISVGVVLGAWKCTGDFTAIDGAQHSLDVRLAASSGKVGYDIAGQVVALNIAPIQPYINTITSAVEVGAVKNDGSANQALQTIGIAVQ